MTHNMKKSAPHHKGAWFENFNDLKSFQLTNGHCLVPQNSTQNSRLALWVKRQRSDYKLFKKGKKDVYDSNKIEMLDSIGFVWDFYDDKWNKSYQELRIFLKEYGNDAVPSKKLCTWTSTQRTQYKRYCDGEKSSMTPERVTLLESIGFKWSLHNSNKERPPKYGVPEPVQNISNKNASLHSLLMEPLLNTIWKENEDRTTYCDESLQDTEEKEDSTSFSCFEDAMPTVEMDDLTPLPFNEDISVGTLEAQCENYSIFMEPADDLSTDNEFDCLPGPNEITFETEGEMEHPLSATNCIFEKVLDEYDKCLPSSNCHENSKQPIRGPQKELPIDFQPTEYDVICGIRGKSSYDHVGNRIFRKIVGEQLEAYSGASRSTKSRIVSNIIQSIHTRGGRFVKQLNKRWHDVGDGYARERVGQTIRDLLAYEFSSSTLSKKKRRQERRQSREADRPKERFAFTSKMEGLLSKLESGRIWDDDELLKLFTETNIEILNELNTSRKRKEMISDDASQDDASQDEDKRAQKKIKISCAG